jgi:transposase
MTRFVAGADRAQSTLLPECLDGFIDESNPVRVIDAFVDALDLEELGFDGVEASATGWPSYHPSVLLKLYIYGCLNRVQSSRRLEREAGRNVEVMWLLGRLMPDHKTIADFRKDNGASIRKVCARFVELCRAMGLLTKASVVIDGSKFKAVNNRDRTCRETGRHASHPLPSGAANTPPARSHTAKTAIYRAGFTTTGCVLCASCSDLVRFTVWAGTRTTSCLI